MTSINVKAIGVDKTFILDSVSSELKAANVLLIGSNLPVPCELFEEESLIDNGRYNDANPIECLNYIQAFNKALRTDKIKLIVCVNSAALIACALAGGKLIQEVNNHSIQGLHRIKGSMGEFLVPSNHTQMMYLNDMNPKDYQILLYSLSKSDKYVGNNIEKTNNPDFKEPEYVLFKNFRVPVLAIMPDINKMRLNTRTVRMTNKLINKYLNE